VQPLAQPHPRPWLDRWRAVALFTASAYAPSHPRFDRFAIIKLATFL
jgi:hypothetical protein